MTKGRIAVIISEIFDPLDYELMNGIHSRAKALNYDVIVLSGVKDTGHLKFRGTISDPISNIYQLAGCTDLDGIIFNAESFYGGEAEAQIFSLLEGLDIPCISIGRQHNFIRSIFPDQKRSVRVLTEHLITVHNCRKLYFLSGTEGEYNSEMRYEGFLEAISSAGIPKENTQLFYGDYWRDKPYELGTMIAKGELPRPDAVVCASDVMAENLTDSLIAGGIRVPEEIRVTGYDGEWFAMLHTPSITTVTGQRFDTGCRAVDMLLGCDPSPAIQKIFYGRSCGCNSGNMISRTPHTGGNWIERELIGSMQRYMEHGRYISGDIADTISRSDSLPELIEHISSFTDLIMGWLRLDICLCTDWQINTEKPENCRRNGFSPQMHLIMDKQRYNDDGQPVSFQTRQILPFLEDEHEPLLIVMTSLSCGKDILGYIAMEYFCADDICLNAEYMSWYSSVSSGFAQLRRKLYREYIQHRSSTLTIMDPATGFLNQRGFLEKLTELSDSNIIVVFIGICEGAIIDSFHIVSTALRLSSPDGEVISVAGDNLFALINASDDTSPNEQSFQRLLLLTREMIRIQGDDVNTLIPLVITEHICSDGTPQEDLVRKTAQLAGSVKERMNTGALDSISSALYQLRLDIYLHPEKDLSINDMAETMNFSRSYFQRIYKEHFGVSCKDDVIAARLEKAKYLLANTQMSVSEIAASSGYNEVNHFIRQFRERTGTTALTYRKTAGKKNSE